MPERLPTFAESPYYNILTGWLLVNHNADGTLKSSVGVPSTSTDVALLNGSTVGLFNYFHPTSVGSSSQRAVGIEIEGIASGGSSIDRIALYAGAETGGGTGAGTGNRIWAANFIVQANSADTDTQVIGVELNVNNNKDDATSDLSGSALKYGYSVDSGGSKICSIGYGLSASGGTWRRGFRVAGSAIATGGYAFEYTGDGTNGPFRITSDAMLVLGTTVTTSGAAKDAIFANAAWLRWANAAGTDTIQGIRVNGANQVVLGGNASDIVWGKALVSLGGGSTATLGTVGGTGPVTATQNTWLRVLDSAGNAAWVPVWK